MSTDSEGGAPDNYEAYAVASTLMNVAGVALAMERCEGKAPCNLAIDRHAPQQTVPALPVPTRTRE